MRAWIPIALIAGCVPPPVYRVQRTARVPHAAAPLRTGEPLAGPIELSVGASSIGDLRSPRLADSEASLEVPGRQMRGELRIGIGRAELAGIYEGADGASMIALDPTQAPVEEGAPTGVGIATRYSIDLKDGYSLGLGLEGMTWKIPYVEYRTCVTNCSENGVGTSPQMFRGGDSVSTPAFSFIPTYRRGNIAAFTGLYIRRHPTIVRKGEETYSVALSDDVDRGNFNWLAYAGVEYRLPVVSAMLTIQQNLTSDPVSYGPSFGFAIALRVPHAKPRRARAPEPLPRDMNSNTAIAEADDWTDATAPAPPYRPRDLDAELPDDPW